MNRKPTTRKRKNPRPSGREEVKVEGALTIETTATKEAC